MKYAAFWAESTAGSRLVQVGPGVAPAVRAPDPALRPAPAGAGRAPGTAGEAAEDGAGRPTRPELSVELLVELLVELA
jgi:hypothetical protein